MEPSFSRPRARARGLLAHALTTFTFATTALMGTSPLGCGVRARQDAPAAGEATPADPSGGVGLAHEKAGVGPKDTEAAMGDPVAAASATAAPIGLGTVGAFGHADSFGYGGAGVGGGGAAAKKTAMPPGVPLAFDSSPSLAAKPSSAVFGAPAAVAPVPALDPNARYATTYRPGGAALSAFDAALARGALPARVKDLVGEFGARYAPAIEAPRSGAMAFAVGLERAAVGPQGGPLHLRLAMKGSDVSPLRAPLSVHVVLDVSGSMAGASIEHARKAAEALVQKLEPGDHFSLVTFSNDAAVRVAAGPIGPRRAQVLALIRAIETEGGTNVSSGLDLGYAQAQSKGAPEDAVKVVMLLSDGHANGGDTNPKTLAQRSARAFQEGVQTSTFGIGTDFDGALLASIADQGAGAYYYLAEPAQIAPALTKELDARLVPVATALELRVRLRPGIVATKVYGSHALDEAAAALVRAQEVASDVQAQKKDGIVKDRKDDAQGGMRFFVPAFARGDRHAMLLALQLPSGVGSRSIASVEVRYKDRLLKKNVTVELPVSATWAGSDEASAKTIDPSVTATAQAFAAGDAIERAAAQLEVGDRAGAKAALVERAGLLRKAKDLLGEPGLLDDAVRLEKLAELVWGPTQVGDPMVLAVLLRGSSSGYLR